MSILKNLLFITLPVWGTVVFLCVINLIPNGNMHGESALFLGFLLILGGAFPIFTANGLGIFGKVFLFVLYAGISVVAMFIVGWSTLLWLGYGH